MAGGSRPGNLGIIRGFAVPWAQEILPDPHSALFVCGYQDEESAGRALQRLASREDPTAPATLTLLTDTGPATVSVAARVETYSLSAHPWAMATPLIYW